jgi:hypothetical protein
MSSTKSYYVDPVLDENAAGFICYCFLNQQQIDRRLFRDQHRAEDYGCEWLGSSLTKSSWPSSDT